MRAHTPIYPMPSDIPPSDLCSQRRYSLRDRGHADRPRHSNYRVLMTPPTREDGDARRITWVMSGLFSGACLADADPLQQTGHARLRARHRRILPCQLALQCHDLRLVVLELAIKGLGGGNGDSCLVAAGNHRLAVAETEGGF